VADLVWFGCDAGHYGRLHGGYGLCWLCSLDAKQWKLLSMCCLPTDSFREKVL
jgi:hypothetical protein